MIEWFSSGGNLSRYGYLMWELGKLGQRFRWERLPCHYLVVWSDLFTTGSWSIKQPFKYWL